MTDFNASDPEDLFDIVSLLGISLILFLNNLAILFLFRFR